MMSCRIKKALAVSARAFFVTLLFGALVACSDQGINLNDPAEVYQTYCFACHDTGAVKAPVLSDRDFWQAVANDRERLYRVTLKGNKAMPAKGTCLNCTDQQLTDVVDWMIDQP